MIKQFRIAFGLKMGSSIPTFRAPQDANAPEASLEAKLDGETGNLKNSPGFLPENIFP